jgi:hypothetical protein
MLFLHYITVLLNIPNSDEDIKRVLRFCLENSEKFLFLSSSPRELSLATASCSGHALCKLATAKRSSPWRDYRSCAKFARLGELLLARARFISLKNPARHDCSPWARCGEFTQNLPCFTKNHILTVLTPTILILSHAITQCI